MKAENWEQLKSLFHAALDLDAGERATFLGDACAGKDELRRRVEALLIAHEQAGTFLASPALVDAGVIAAGEHEEQFAPEPLTWLAGKHIGPYEIIREIGHGGMGKVYLAIRADDQYRKRVAIKLIKRGMDTDTILRRFVMERQILANLEHPNIALLLDGGTNTDGLPYFVMEYIEGQPITEYCDERRFSTAERLELFRHVCSALQYAHQNLVVHRDIKPSNIMVTAEGVPKLLDFGIAKLLSPNWNTETSDATLSMMPVMTPEYASPEQLRGLPITTASDVYSLGVVLYELLSGHRPYRLTSRQPEEVARVILQDEPLKPSLVITITEELHRTENDEAICITPESVGRTREGTIERLRRHLSGDLDNIVLKALRKEPQRRYASVQEFAEDIRRHLAGLPVTARHDTFTYRAGKFIKRHKAGGVAAVVVILALLIGTATTAWQAHVARRERERAEHRFSQVRQLARAVLFEYHDQIAKLPGSTPLREKMIKDALIYLDNLAAESSNDAGLQREIAAAYQKVGDVQGGSSQANLGNRDEAIKSYRKALGILESATTARPDNQLLIEIAAVHGKLYLLLWKMSQQDEAEKHSYRALTIREQLAASEPDNLTYRLALARSYRDFGGMLASKTRRDGEGAIAYYRKSNELCDSIVKTDSSNLEARAIAGLGYRMLGAEFEANEPQKAMEYYQKALALTQEREMLDSQNAQIPIVLADCYSNIGRALMMQGDERGALEDFRRAMVIFERGLLEDPTNALLKMNLSQTYNNIGNAMAQSDQLPQALENYRQALNLREAYLKEHPTESGFQFRLAETTFDLGDLYAKMATRNAISVKDKARFWREAKSWYQRSLEIWQTLSKNGTLPGYLAAKPDETAKAADECDKALEQLYGKNGVLR